MSTILPTDRSSSEPAGPASESGPGPSPAPGPGARLFFARCAVARRAFAGHRLGRHVLALGVLVAALIPVAGTRAVWSADEGALLYQAVAVSEGRGWTFAHPFPAADPDGTWYPLHLASVATDGGYVVLGKHTAFVRLAGFLHAIGGYRAIIVFSVAWLVVAAGAAAILAGRLERRAAVPALWLTGIASPLFPGAYVAWAHTLAAALVGWGLVGLTTGLSTATMGGSTTEGSTGEADRPGPVHRWGYAMPWVAGAVALGAACLIRTEAALAGLAATSALSLPVMRRVKADSWRSAAAGPARPMVLAGVGTLIGIGLDRQTSIGLRGPVIQSGDDWGGLVGRVEGFAHTWLRPDFSPRPEHLLFLLAAAAVLAAAILARRRPADDPAVIGLVALAAFAIVARFLVSPVALIPGLLVAFPTLFAGLILARRTDIGRGAAPVLAGFVTTCWLAVLATQYRYGGGGEWGGRYFAIGLPAAVAVATPPLLRLADALRGPARHRMATLGLIIAVFPVAMAILSLRASRDGTLAITDRVEASLVEPGDGGTPVVATTLAPLGRWAWDDLDHSRWLLIQDETQVSVLGSRLAALDIDRFTFVTDDPDAELTQLADWYVPIDPIPAGPSGSLDRVVIPVRAVHR